MDKTKNKILIGSIGLALVLGMTGCSKFNGKSSVASSGHIDSTGKKGIAYIVDEDFHPKESELGYIQKNRLIELEFNNAIEVDADKVFYIQTLGGQFEGTLVDKNKIYYIGEAPTEETPITEISYESIEEKNIPKSEISNVNGKYIYKTPIEGIRKIALTSKDGGYIPIDMEGEDFIIEIPKNIYDNSEEFMLTTWKDIPVEF